MAHLSKGLEQEMLEAVNGLRKTLDAIAILKLADNFYTLDERITLLKKANELWGHDQAAYQKMQDARCKDGLSWEQRVAQFGEGVAKTQNEPFMQAFEARKATAVTYDQFLSEHPILKKLIEMRETFTKRIV